MLDLVGVESCLELVLRMPFRALWHIPLRLVQSCSLVEK